MVHLDQVVSLATQEFQATQVLSLGSLERVVFLVKDLVVRLVRVDFQEFRVTQVHSLDLADTVVPQATLEPAARLVTLESVDIADILVLVVPQEPLD